LAGNEATTGPLRPVGRNEFVTNNVSGVIHSRSQR
jgi:hypothetical protein